MTCASCVRHVEKALLAVPGVTAASVNLATGRAKVSVLSAVAPLALVTAIEDAGYTAAAEADPNDLGANAPKGPTHAERAAEELARLRLRALVSLAIGTAMMIGMWLPVDQAQLAPVWLVLATIVQFWAGGGFFKSAWSAAKHGTANMHTLVVVGTSVAYGTSTLATLWPAIGHSLGLHHHLYFDSSVMIIALVLFGRYLEGRARSRAGEAIERLVTLRPKTAVVVRGAEDVVVPVEALRVGERVRVRPGEIVPTDGVILEGRSTIDESLVTGESVPVEKGEGDGVIGATLNGAGGLLVRVAKVGKDTALAQIVRLVEEAQAGKAPIQRKVDEIAAVFVPGVIGLALLTFFGWWAFGPSVANALEAATAVLIIACPCALGLATPSAILVGTGRAAELGILVRSADALEAAVRVNTIVLDKTGTLTRGKPAVVAVRAGEGGLSPDDVLRIAAAAERSSEHPIASAIVAHARALGLRLPKVQQVTAHAGVGLEAVVDGAPVRIGNRAFMRLSGLEVGALATDADALADTGATPVFVARAGLVVGLIAVADPVKPEAAATVAALKALGFEVWMATGDLAATGAAVARTVGIEHVLSEVRPDGKAAHVRALQAKGRCVAMVGDGINDSPALAQADLGIALGTGTDVAVSASDLTLMTGDLTKIPVALALSRRTVQTIRWGLVWAFGYNIVLIPVAMGLALPLFGVMLDPKLAAGAMAMSSVSVVVNALRLRKFEPRALA